MPFRSREFLIRSSPFGAAGWFPATALPLSEVAGRAMQRLGLGGA